MTETRRVKIRARKSPKNKKQTVHRERGGGKRDPAMPQLTPPEKSKGNCASSTLNSLLKYSRRPRSRIQILQLRYRPDASRTPCRPRSPQKRRQGPADPPHSSPRHDADTQTPGRKRTPGTCRVLVLSPTGNSRCRYIRIRRISRNTPSSQPCDFRHGPQRSARRLQPQWTCS